MAIRIHAVGAVFQRNFYAYFGNPTAYLFIAVFVVATAVATFFPESFFAANLAELTGLNRWMPWLLIAFMPTITMAAWADEQRLGTYELLLTLPVRDIEVVLGKYLAALAVYSVALVFALSNAFLLAYLGDPDWGLIRANYFGYWLMGAAMLPLGLVASVLTANTTIAFILGAVFCAVALLAESLGRLTLGLGSSGGLGAAIGIRSHFQNFTYGVVALPDLLYFVLLTAIGIYANTLLVGRRLWYVAWRRAFQPAVVLSVAAVLGIIWVVLVPGVLKVAVLLLVAGVYALGRRFWPSRLDAAHMDAHFLLRGAAVVAAAACISILAGRWVSAARLDLTVEKINSLSAGTRQLLRNLPGKHPIYIRAFVSAKVPESHAQTRETLLRFLRELDAIGGPRIEVEIIDTAVYSDEARRAEENFGIRPQAVVEMEEGYRRTRRIFMGVAFTSGPEETVIPFLDQGLPVEYELVRSVRVVARDKDLVEMPALGGEGEVTVDEWLKKAGAKVAAGEEIVKVSRGDVSAVVTSDIAGKLTRIVVHKGKKAAPGETLAMIEAGFRRKIGVLRTDAKVFGGMDFQTMAVQDPWPIVDELKKQYEVVEASPDSEIAEDIDALVVVLPSTLTQPQLDVLKEYVMAGRPALIFVDPLPMIVTLSPSMPKPRPGGPFGGGGQQPQEKGDIEAFLAEIGLRWEKDKIVWDLYNALPRESGIPPEVIFVCKEAGGDMPYNLDEVVVKDLRRVVALYSGALEEIRPNPRFKVIPLLKTGPDSGEERWGDIVRRNPFFGQAQIIPPRRHFLNSKEYILAVRVTSEGQDAVAKEKEETDQGKSDADSEKENGDETPRGVNVIVVADMDMIGHQFFQMRKRGPREVQFDNVTFLLNCVDFLAGDEALIDLRSRQPKYRTLTAIEQKKQVYDQKMLADEKKADEEAIRERDEANRRFQEKLAAIDKRTDLDEQARGRMKAFVQNSAQKRLDAKQAEIGLKKENEQQKARDQRERGIQKIQAGIRFLAVNVPPIPVILIGVIVFLFQLYREKAGIPLTRAMRR